MDELATILPWYKDRTLDPALNAFSEMLPSSIFYKQQSQHRRECWLADVPLHPHRPRPCSLLRSQQASEIVF